MATQSVRISTMLHEAEVTTTEVQESVVQAMGYVAYSRGTTNYPIAAQSTSQALAKATQLLDQLRELRSALDSAPPIESY